MKINILDSSVYNKISAGEVVENPASVVKELIENSIDAGADEITVCIESGGIKSIVVSDNGSGIPKEELPNALLAHATSKIADAEDLFNISTLGFRGEALASIAAVSEVEIKSKYFKAETGAMLISNAGNLTVKDLAFNRGTTISISNLFYNVPARYKFLKTPKGEGGAITTLIEKLILANPFVSIKYISDGKQVFFSSGEGLWDALTAVYSPDITALLIPITKGDGKITVSGYIGRGELYKSNRALQTIILNGRIISDQTISHTVQNAYGERMMQRQFPVFILNIIMPFDEVDINVHPNKKEARFSRPREVYGAVYQATKYTLEAYEKSALLNFTNKRADAHEIEKKVAASDGKEESFYLPPITQSKDIPQTSINAAKTIDISEYLSLLKLKQDKKGLRVEESAEIYGASEILRASREYQQASQSDDLESISEKKEQKQTSYRSYKVIGQAFSTYLIVETEGNLLIVDQHAAHERILYDKLTLEIEAGEVHVQPMLIPYIYEGSPSEILAIEDMIPDLKTIGFDIEPFGSNSIKINATPLILSELNLNTFISDIISEYGGRGASLSRLIKNKLMQSACKAAIKSGDTLTDDQISFIVGYFFDNSMPLKCPHGRPAYISYSKLDLEKLFRRKL